jgi:anti-sigma B factor antagonist
VFDERRQACGDRRGRWTNLSGATRTKIRDRAAFEHILKAHSGEGANMRLEIAERQVGAVTILDLAGNLTIDQDAQRLKDKINSLIQQERLAVVLNLGEVTYIDSGGLGQLVASYGSLSKTAGGLKLLHVNKRNHDLLSITRLVTIFDTFDSEDEAVKSFAKAALA